MKFSKTASSVLLLLTLLPFFAKAQPINDNFANRLTIETNVSGSLADATFETGEPVIDGVSTGQTAWWTWTAPSNGIVSLQIQGTGFNPLLSIYTGNILETLSLVANNTFLACYETTNCGCHWRVRNRTDFHVQQGVSYQFAVDSALFTDTYYAYRDYSSFPYRVTFQVGDVVVIPGLSSVPNPGPERTTNVVSGGNVALQLHFTPAPKNDDFANRVKLRGSRFQIEIKNFGATPEPGEPLHLGNHAGSSVWYSWVSPATGRVTLSINRIPPYPQWYGSFSLSMTDVWGMVPSCGDLIDQNPPPQFFPLFAAYTGSSVDSLTSAKAVPMQLEDYPNAVEFDVEKGQTYQIAFDGNGGTTGEVPMYLAITKPAMNDDFKRRIKLNGLYAVAVGHNAGATRQAGEPVPLENSRGKSVWWTWRSPVNGTASISSWSSDHSFPISVFTGSTISNLNLVAAGRTNVLFEVSAGQSYQISVSDLEGRTGAVKLHVQGPEVELSLLEQISSKPKAALLRYEALPRQTILLQRFTNEDGWKNVRKVTARRDTVDFLVSPAPTQSIRYRAIIIGDYSR